MIMAVSIDMKTRKTPNEECWYSERREQEEKQGGKLNDIIEKKVPKIDVNLQILSQKKSAQRDQGRNVLWEVTELQG